MGSPTPERSLTATRALVARYLNPDRRWDRRRDAELRKHVRESEQSAEVYRRAVTTHRLMVGSDPGTPSGFERQRMMVAVLPDEGPAVSLRRWAVFVGTCAAAAAIIFVGLPMLPDGATGPGADDWLQARGLSGDLFGERLVGVGVAGVSEGGTEYEIIASAKAGLGDYVRVSYTNEAPELTHLFLFGLQPERAPDEQLVWLAPVPEERESLAITVSRFRNLPFEIKLSARHEPGPLRIVALFTTRVVTTDELAQALDSTPSTLLPSQLMDVLSRRLHLSEDARLQILETRLAPGSPVEEDTP